MDFYVLYTELTTDPLGRGYAAMDEQEQAVDLNTVYRTLTRDTLSSAEIYERIDVAEFQGKSPEQKVYVRDILGLGEGIAVGLNSKARTVLLAIFGAGSATIAALAAALEVAVSRAVELGLGRVYPRDITTAYERYGG